MKMIMFFRRKAGLSPEQFKEHYETHHAPLALKLFPWIKDYRRNYIRHDLQHRRAGGEAMGAALDFDVMVEVSFDGEDDYQRMVDAMANPAIRDQVVADEERFMDRGATVVLLADEQRTPPSALP